MHLEPAKFQSLCLFQEQQKSIAFASDHKNSLPIVQIDCGFCCEGIGTTDEDINPLYVLYAFILSSL